MIPASYKRAISRRDEIRQKALKIEPRLIVLNMKAAPKTIREMYRYLNDTIGMNAYYVSFSETDYTSKNSLHDIELWVPTIELATLLKLTYGGR